MESYKTGEQEGNGTKWTNDHRHLRLRPHPYDRLAHYSHSIVAGGLFVTS